MVVLRKSCFCSYVRALVLRTLLEWAFIVLSVTRYYLLIPSLTGYLVLFDSSKSEIDIFNPERV